MAIYHCSVKVMSRSKGRSVIASAAYRSATILTDETTGAVFDYTRKRGVVTSFIRAPKGAPSWIDPDTVANDNMARSALWHAAEKAEKRKNSRVAREVIVALPYELSDRGRVALVENFADWLIDRYQVAVDAAIHSPHVDGDQRNFHAHLLMTTRMMTDTGLGKKTRVLDDGKKGPKEIQNIRIAWEGFANDALASIGADIRIDHRSHQERGIDTPPQIHVGVKTTNLHRKRKRLAQRAEPPIVQQQAKRVLVETVDVGRYYQPANDYQSRAERNAEIIALQKYQDCLATPKFSEHLLSLEAQIEALGDNIEACESLLVKVGRLSPGLKARLKDLIEKFWARIRQQSTKAEKEQARLQRKAERQKVKRQMLLKQLSDLQYKYKAELKLKKALVKYQVIAPTVQIQVNTLNMCFNEALYQRKIERLSSYDLGQKLSARPKIANTRLNCSELRYEMLMVKEVLKRSSNRKIETTSDQSKHVEVKQVFKSANRQY